MEVEQDYMTIGTQELIKIGTEGSVTPLVNELLRRLEIFLEACGDIVVDQP